MQRLVNFGQLLVNWEKLNTRYTNPAIFTDPSDTVGAKSLWPIYNPKFAIRSYFGDQIRWQEWHLNYKRSILAIQRDEVSQLTLILSSLFLYCYSLLMNALMLALCSTLACCAAALVHVSKTPLIVNQRSRWSGEIRPSFAIPWFPHNHWRCDVGTDDHVLNRRCITNSALFVLIN